MPGKTIWKTGIGGIAKASRDIALEPQKGGGGVYSAPYETPVARGQRADARWVMAYGYKLIPSWKTEVSKSAWIKPFCVRDHSPIESSHNDAKFQTQPPSTLHVKMQDLPKIDVHNFSIKFVLEF